MPSFHMEHCVFATFLSSGTSIKDCGLVCTKHKLKIEDPYGGIHPITADHECRNTMYNGKAQSSLKLIDKLSKLGISLFRLEALGENKEELRDKINIYLDYLSGKSDLMTTLKKVTSTERYGLEFTRTQN